SRSRKGFPARNNTPQKKKKNTIVIYYSSVVTVFAELFLIDENKGMSVSQSGANSSVSSGVMTAVNSNAIPVSRPLFMPETFTGVGREWSDWSEQFEMGVNGWDNELKLKFLSLLFSGRARYIYGGLPYEAKNKYALLKDAMGKCLEPCESADWNWVSFSSRCRLPNESLVIFYNCAGVFLTDKVAGCETCLFIDTSTQISIVPKQFWLNVSNGGSSLDGYQGKVAMANGGEMSILGRWQTVCQFDSLAVIVEFLVADVTPQELLLGTDFLSKFGEVIDLGEKCCRLMVKKLPLFSEDGSVQPKVVRVQADIMIPPHTEAIVPGKVEGLLPQHYEGMLEPFSIMLPTCDVLVA
uniref:Peptidase A2 domain-containing protein n=1 Tax=Sinocyclocheilus rhinocerous TaxID=307959 RepID=A0A673HHN6_9TELE